MVRKGGPAYPVAMLPPPSSTPCSEPDHAANLTGEICQPSNFEQNRPIRMAVVACQRLVGYLTLRGEVLSGLSLGTD